MRIEFYNSAREDFHWDQAQLRIGGAPRNDLVLAAHQAAAEHLLITQDRRGWILEVLPGASRIYVNARPVRERALLRAGDMLSIGECRMLLHADEDPLKREPLLVSDQHCCPIALRAVSGPYSGRVFPLRDRLELGPHTANPLELPQGEVASLRILWRDGGLWLEQPQASTHYPLRVNGSVAGGDLALLPGDQLGLASHRFVLDAPGMPPEPQIVPPAYVREPLPEDLAGPRGEVWWLIVTAAVLALGIALVLLIRL
jgi:hypothetical protein